MREGGRAGGRAGGREGGSEGKREGEVIWTCRPVRTYGRGYPVSWPCLPPCHGRPEGPMLPDACSRRFPPVNSTLTFCKSMNHARLGTGRRPCVLHTLSIKSSNDNAGSSLKAHSFQI